MRAAVLYACGTPLRIVESVEVPPPGPGQVHVRLAYSGVCHSQLMEVRGGRGVDRFLPHLLGHEGSGVVLAVGDGVTKVGPGDRVVLGWIRGEGADAPGPRYRVGDTVLNAGGVTTFNSEAIVAENRCVKLPEGVPLDVAVLFGCAVPTGAGIVFNELAPPAGAQAAVFGLGGIGMVAAMALRAAGCRVIAVDIEAAKLEAARALGVTDTIDARHDDPVQAIGRLTEGRGVDFAVDAAGRVRTIEQAYAVVRKFGGLCVFASHPPNGERLSLDPHDLISGKQIRGSWGGASQPDTDVPRFATLYREGRLPVGRLLGKRYSLDQINDALDDLEAGRVMRPLIVLDDTITAEPPGPAR
jgi:S-(hydroxymethyl)glutathione dehydrogenase/alcohol dehydrogenase